MTERYTGIITKERVTETERREEVRRELASYTPDEPLAVKVSTSGTIFERIDPKPIITTVKPTDLKLPINSSFRWLTEYDKRKKKLLR